jgi:hypothetical protein
MLSTRIFRLSWIISIIQQMDTSKNVAPLQVSLAVKCQPGSLVLAAALEAPAWQDPLVLEFQYRCRCAKVRVVMHHREVVIRSKRRGQ